MTNILDYILITLKSMCYIFHIFFKLFVFAHHNSNTFLVVAFWFSIVMLL